MAEQLFIMTTKVATTKTRKPRVKAEPLPVYYKPDENQFEIGIDEAGRGPLFGRLYVAGAVLPKDGSIDMTYIRDSKKLTKKKLDEMYEYICEKAVVYHVEYVESKTIDIMNIREAVLMAMRICGVRCVEKLNEKKLVAVEGLKPYFLCVDGNDCPACHYQEELIPGRAFTSGDNSYGSMAAASILAKVSRDRYIYELCQKYPKLSELYKMDSHKGYGTAAHLNAIRTYGITEHHRKSFGLCKTAPCNDILSTVENTKDEEK